MFGGVGGGTLVVMTADAAGGSRAGSPHPPPRFVLRPATLSDLPALHGLAARAMRELLGGVHYTTAQIRAATAVRVHQVEPALVEAGTYFVVEVDGRVVAGSGWSRGGALQPGRGATDGAWAVDGATAAMRATYVEPRWARRGLATLLAHTTETAAAIAGCTCFEALCTPASEALRRSLGYRLVQRVEFPLTGGITLGAARMRKSVAS